MPEGSSFCNTCGVTTPATAPANVAATPHWQDLFAEPKTDGKAIASLVFGCLFFLFPAALLAIILGHLSLSEIRRSAGRMKGKGLAIGGLVLGYFGVTAIPLLFVIMAATLIPTISRQLAGTQVQTITNEPPAVSSIRALNASEIGFSAAHREMGFTCKLDELVGPSASYGWIDPALASGRKNGYIFVVQNCIAARAGGPNTKYQITGYPERKQNGFWAFCSNESAVVRYDVSGSPQNCLMHGADLQ